MNGLGSSRVSVWSLQKEIQHLLIMISALVLEGRIRCEQVLHAELMKLLCSFPSMALLVLFQRSCLRRACACARLPESHAVSLGENPCRVRHPKLNCPSGIYSSVVLIIVGLDCACVSFLRRAWRWIFSPKILSHRDRDGLHLPIRAEGRLLI